jgi:FtsH-binding integral membrane protein
MTKLNDFVKLMRNKSGLLNCIFFTLITQITLTIGFIKLLNMTETTNEIINRYQNSFSMSILLFLLLIISIVLLYIMIKSSLSYSQKYMVFTLFSLIEAFFLHIILSTYSDETIEFAFYSTIAIFISLFIFGLVVVYLGYDLGWLGLILFMSLFILIIIQLIFMFMGNYETYQKIFAVISLTIFMLYIIYDTNKILLKYNNTNDYCIIGALDYYLDILNIFIDLLRLSGDK